MADEQDQLVLLAELAEEVPAAPKSVKEAQVDALLFPMAKLELREKNVRSSLPDITDLAASIQVDGIIEPLIAVPLENGNAQLIAGYRRYHAALQLKLTHVPVRLLNADENKRHRIALIENLQRADMNVVDKAVGIAKLIEDSKIDQREAAKLLGVSEGYISQHLTVLRLPKKAQGALRAGEIELSHARQLARVKDEEKVLEFLKAAPELTSTALASKVDFYVQKEKEKEAKVAQAAKTKARAARKAKLGIEEEEEEELTMADEYASQKLDPLKKADMLAALQYYANKYERAESDGKKAEYKHILRGLEIASGLYEFTP